MAGSSAKKENPEVSLKSHSRQDGSTFSSLSAVVFILARLHLKCTSWRSDAGKSHRPATPSILSRLHKKESNSEVLM